MDDKRPVNKNDNIGNSPKLKDRCEVISEEQPEKSIKKSKRTGKRNLPSEGEYESENQSLHSGRFTKKSSGLSIHASKPLLEVPGKLNQLDDTSSCSDVEDDIDIETSRNRTDFFNSTNAFISPQNPTSSCTPILEHSKASGSKSNQRSPSSFGEKHDTDFVSPPQYGVLMTSSLSKILQKTNTPSPENRRVEMDGTCTPTKRIKRTPESYSEKFETENESSRSKISLSTAADTLYKSLTNLPAQEMKDSARKNDESESTASEGKGLCKSILRSPSSPANVVHKSSTNLQTQESKVIERNVEESESFTEDKTLIYFQDNLPFYSTYSNSLVKHSNPDNLRQTGSFINLSADKRETIVYLNAKLKSSTVSNLDRRKSKCSQSAPDLSEESVLPHLPFKQSETVVHPSTSTDVCLFNARNNSRKRKEMPTSDVLFESCQPDVTENEPESAVHLLKITGKAFSSNLKTTSKPQNSTPENCESCTKVTKTLHKSPVFSKETRSVSSDNSVVLTQMMRKFQSSDINLNPHFPPQSDSSATNIPHRVLAFESSDEIEIIDENRPRSSVRTSTSTRASSCQSKASLALKRLGMLRRSRSDETLKSRDSSDVQMEPEQYNSLIKLKETSVSRNLPEITSDVCRKSCVVKPVARGSLPKSASTTPSARRIPQEYRTQYDISNQLLTEALSSNEPSTSLNNPAVRMQRNFSGPLLERSYANSISNEISLLRNRPVVGSDINPPYIDVFEGEASTSRHQPLITEGSSFNQPDFHTSEASTLRHQPSDGEQFNSSDEQSDSSSDASQSGDAYERILGTFEPVSLSRADRCPEYTSGALMLLQPVLREMMVYSGENSTWMVLAGSFLRFSHSCSTKNRLNLYSDLMKNLYTRELLRRNFSLALDTTIESDMVKIHERLISLVIETLAFSVALRASRDFHRLIFTYVSFRNLYSTYSRYWQNNNIENIVDEASRNRVVNLKKMIQRFFLVTLMAFRLLLIYIGENVNERKIPMYEEQLWEEDKKYLRRII